MPPAKLSPAPGGVDDLFCREGRQHEHVAVADQHAAVLAFLDDDKLGAELQHVLGGFDEVLLFRQQPGFAVVQHQAMNLAEQLHQLVPLGGDPEVHRVGDHESGVLHARQHLLLQRRVGVGEEDVLAVEELLGNLGGTLGEHVQVDLDRHRLVHVLDVRPVPAEGLAALADFKPLVSMSRPSKTFSRSRGQSSPTAPDQADVGEERSRVREVDGRAADDVVALAEGGFDGINSERAGDE